MNIEGQLPGGAQPKRSLSIRARLMLLAIAAILPLILERVHDVQSDRAERIELASQQVLELARQGMERHYDIIIAARAFLQVLSRVYPTVAASGGDSCPRLLTALAKDLVWARAVSVVAPDGSIRCSNIAAPAGFNVSRQPFFQQLLKAEGFATGDFHIGRRTGVPVIYTGLTQRAPNGDVEAIFSISIDLDWLAGLTTSIGRRLHATVLLLDGSGTVLARYPDQEKLVGRSFSDHALVRQILSRPEGSVTGTSIDGIRHVFGFAQLPGTHARIAIGFDESAVLRPIDWEMLTALAQLAAIAALVLIGIWFGGERVFVRPLRALAQTAGRLGRGEHTASPAESVWAAEFIPLATALGTVAGQLAARERELRATAGRLQELAEIDSLTGLANRRAFDARLEAEWRVALKTGQPVALLMIDVDHFKLFNDHYGHVAGDSCLCQVGDALAAATRTGAALVADAGVGQRATDIQGADADTARLDALARYGGEEFVVLLPGLDLALAMLAAERLRVTVERLALAHAGAPLGHVTVSIGVAADRPRPEFSARALIEAADAALYVAKRSGRNTVATMGLAPVLAEAS